MSVEGRAAAVAVAQAMGNSGEPTAHARVCELQDAANYLADTLEPLGAYHWPAVDELRRLSGQCDRVREKMAPKKVRK